MILKTKLLDSLFNEICTLASWNSLDHSVKVNVFLNRHRLKYKIRLRAVADQLSCFFKVFIQIVASDFYLATCR